MTAMRLQLQVEGRVFGSSFWEALEKPLNIAPRENETRLE